MKIVVRGDSGYCRNELMSRCEGNKVDFVFGLAPIRSCVRSFLPTENALSPSFRLFPACVGMTSILTFRQHIGPGAHPVAR